MNVFGRIAAILVVGVSLGACESAPQGEDALVHDPYENFNRSVHSLNKGLDSAVLRPASRAYDLVTPTLFKHIFGNAVSNLELPGIFINHMLQGEAEDALATFGRFTVNTIYGAGGALDPATELGLPKEPTDFGLTLASWGVDEGAYLELPLFGPSTARDTVGIVVDMAFQPTTYISGGTEVAIVSATVSALEIVDKRDRRGVLIDDLLYRSEDSYISLRANYIQNRRRAAAGGETNVDELPDLFSN